jgi:hypothetical protein
MFAGFDATDANNQPRAPCGQREIKKVRRSHDLGGPITESPPGTRAVGYESVDTRKLSWT